MSGVLAGLKALGPKRLAALGGVGSALLALLALTLPTRRALRSRPVDAIGVGE